MPFIFWLYILINYIASTCVKLIFLPHFVLFCSPSLLQIEQDEGWVSVLKMKCGANGD